MSWDVWHAASHPPKIAVGASSSSSKPSKGSNGSYLTRPGRRWRVGVQVVLEMEKYHEQYTSKKWTNYVQCLCCATLLKYQVTTCTPHPDDFLHSRLNPGTLYGIRNGWCCHLVCSFVSLGQSQHSTIKGALASSKEGYTQAISDHGIRIPTDPRLSRNLENKLAFAWCCLIS